MIPAELRDEIEASLDMIECSRRLALALYDEAIADVVTQQAAYGLAVSSIQHVLQINLRTAAVLFEEWLSTWEREIGNSSRKN